MQPARPADPSADPIVLFDLDGTITDSAPGVVRSFRVALERYGVALPDGDMRSRIVGPPMAATMATLGVSAELEADLLAAYHEHYSSAGWHDTGVYPGIARMLAALSDLPGRPLRLAVTTSKQQTVARRILAEQGLAGHFEVIAGADGERRAKADVIAHALAALGAHAASPDGRCTAPIMLVGDRSHDVRGGLAHGIPTAFVRWGYGPPYEADGAAWRVDGPEQLEELIMRHARTADAPPGDRAPGDVHVTFVCTGNICRSPMAEKIVGEHLRRAGLAGAVRVTSAGVGDWHVGDPADPRAQAELRTHGYPVGHAAAQLGGQHLGADLIVALDSGHYRAIVEAGADPARVRMLRSFDPASDDSAALDVADPYYGIRSGFTEVREQIEAAVPGLLAWVRSAVQAPQDRR